MDAVQVGEKCLAIAKVGTKRTRAQEKERKLGCVETVGGVHAFVLVCGVHVCGGVGGCVFHESVEVQCAHFLAENILENASSGRRGIQIVQYRKQSHAVLKL